MKGAEEGASLLISASTSGDLVVAQPNNRTIRNIQGLIQLIVKKVAPRTREFKPQLRLSIAKDYDS